jgi:hypothetical protein
MRATPKDETDMHVNRRSFLFVLNPQNETKSLVGVYIKVRSFSGLLGV